MFMIRSLRRKFFGFTLLTAGFFILFIFFTEEKNDQKNDYLIESSANKPRNFDDFQRVEEFEPNIFLYSAYGDIYHGEGIIRLIGAVPKKFNGLELSCKVSKSPKHDEFLIFPGYVKLFSETFVLPYWSSFIICKIPLEHIEILTQESYISINPKDQEFQSHQSSHMLKLTLYQDPNKIKQNVQHKFSVCVRPAYDFDEPLKFTEFVEYYRSMGVTHFTFYNESFGPETSCLMEYYRNIGLIQILPWNLPLIKRVDIHENGQRASLNDCIYRTRGVAQYMLTVDMDEFLVPAKFTSFDQIFNPKNYKALSQADEIRFKNVFFFTGKQIPVDEIQVNNFPAQNLDEKEEMILKKLLLFSNTRRIKGVLRDKLRTKYFIKPESGVEGNIHYMNELKPNAKSYPVPQGTASLFHYRDCYDNDCQKMCYLNGTRQVCYDLKREIINDYFASQNFAPMIASRVSRVLFSPQGINCFKNVVSLIN